jgi:hypothetical protein
MMPRDKLTSDCADLNLFDSGRVWLGNIEAVDQLSVLAFQFFCTAARAGVIMTIMAAARIVILRMLFILSAPL